MTLAACLMMRNEQPYLAEWLAFHSLQGVSHFRIYDNESNDGSSELIDQLAAHFNIERIVWTVPGYLKQVSAFNDAARALAGRYAWVAFLDADEFLFDPLFRPLPAVLAEFGPDIAGIAVNQRVFGSSGLTELSPELVIRRFTRRGPDAYPEHSWIKSVLRPECVKAFQTSHTAVLERGHYVLADGLPFATKSDHPAHADRIARGGLALHHYILKSLAEFRRKQQRGAVSDRKETGYVRLTDDYFTRRDANINEAVDTRLSDVANLVEARIDFALRVTPEPEEGGEPATPLTANKPVALTALPRRFGFYSPDRSGMCWMKQGDRSTVMFQADVTTGKIRIAGYLVAPSYPIGELTIVLNGTPINIANVSTNDRFFNVITEPVQLRARINTLAMSVPFFVPTRFANPTSRDPRYLAVAVAELGIDS